MSIEPLAQNVAQQAVQQLVEAVQRELSKRQMASKIPMIMQGQIVEINDKIIGIDNVLKPVKAIIRREDEMPCQPREEIRLMGKMTTTSRNQLSQIINSGYPFWRRSRQLSRDHQNQQQMNLNINLNDLKQDKVVSLIERSDQRTAKSYRSVIELESNIDIMRTTYLRQRKQEKPGLLQPKFPGQKQQKIPIDFTFDYNGVLIKSKREERINMVHSPLKCKSISACKIIKGKNNQINAEEQPAIPKPIARTAVGSREKDRKVYSNASKRQISHFPFISLIQNSKLSQNKMMISGPASLKQANGQSKHKNKFVHHAQLQKSQSQLCSINDQAQICTFPRDYGKLPINKLNESSGSIVKGSGLNKSIQGLPRQNRALIYKPIKLVREHYTDRYFGIKNQQQIEIS